MAVPDDAAWVALSDQDDRWYPDKLERLVPYLDRRPPSRRARPAWCRWPGGNVLRANDRQAWCHAEDLLVQNQVTGALTVFRRDLLDLALPFPRLRHRHAAARPLAGDVRSGHRRIRRARRGRPGLRAARQQYRWGGGDSAHMDCAARVASDAGTRGRV